MAFSRHLRTALLRHAFARGISERASPEVVKNRYNASRDLFSSSKLFVGGLSWGVDENTLRDAFASYGSVTDVKIATDCETGKSKGYGFISFASNQEAGAALRGMNGKDLLGRTIRADFAVENMGGLRADVKVLKTKHSHGSSKPNNLESGVSKVDVVGTYDNNIGSNWRNL